MALAKVDTATGHANSNDAGNTADFTATITSGVTLALIGLNFRHDVSNLAVSWDSAGVNQTMTRVGTGIFNGARCEIFSLLNPTAGASKNIHVSYTTNSDVVFTWITFSGSDTTVGIRSADTITATGTSTTVAVTVVGATGDATFAVGGQDSGNWVSTTGGTQITLDNVTFVNGAGSYFDPTTSTPTGASNAHSWTDNTSGAWSAMGVHILAAGFKKTQNGVSAVNNVGGVKTISVALASNPTPGNIVCVGVQFFDGTSTAPTWTVADGATTPNTYTVEATNSGSTNMTSAGWIGLAHLDYAPASANKTITVTFNKNFTVASIFVSEFTPPSGSANVDAAASFASGTGTINSPTITATAADLLFTMACDADDVSTPTGSWVANEGGRQLGGSTQYILNAAGNTAAGYNGTSAQAWNCLGMSFKTLPTPVKIQSIVGSNTSANPQTTTFGSSVTAGSVVVACIHLGAAAGTITSVTDNKGGNTWHLAETKTQPLDDDVAFLYYAYINNGGSSFGVTVNASTTIRLDLIEIGPCDPTPLDTHNAGYNAGSTTPNSGNITTSATVKTVAVGFCIDVSAPAGLTAGAGWSGPAATEGSFRSVIWKDAISTSSTVAANGTLSSQEWAMLVASFKGLSSGGGFTPVFGNTKQFLMLMGLGT